MIPTSILSFSNCQMCKRCCKFEADELVDSPAILSSQKKKILKSFGPEFCDFKKRGALWQVELKKIPESDKYICPFYDEGTAKCLIYTYKIFDCLSWPYYIMRKEKNLYLTLSLDCPILCNLSKEQVLEIAEKTVLPKMLKIVKKYPDFITLYHGNVVSLCRIDM